MWRFSRKTRKTVIESAAVNTRKNSYFAPDGKLEQQTDFAAVARLELRNEYFINGVRYKPINLFLFPLDNSVRGVNTEIRNRTIRVEVIFCSENTFALNKRDGYFKNHFRVS